MEMSDHLDSQIPYRGSSDIVVISKKRFDFMLWLERFWYAGGVTISTQDNDVVVRWGKEVFYVDKGSVVQFRDWLLQQPDDEPVAWNAKYRESDKTSMVLMSRGYVRSFQKKFAIVATAIERRFDWK